MLLVLREEVEFAHYNARAFGHGQFHARVQVEDALKHPNWSMGKKITIDSATMVNKGLEVMEAKWLFEVDVDRIEVVVQPQSIIHSMVSYIDGSTIAQLGSPDMRVPIANALSYPDRMESGVKPLDFAQEEIKEILINLKRVDFMNRVKEDLYRQASDKNGIIYYYLNSDE